MGWSKHFELVSPTTSSSKSPSSPITTNYSSYLPEVYAGSPDRLDRYKKYEEMDDDPEIHNALDIVADFCSSLDNNRNNLPFRINFKDEIDESEINVLQSCLMQWTKINRFGQRLFDIFRQTCKYGDQFFIRDPETLEWYWVPQDNIETIKHDPQNGRILRAYVIKDLDFNVENLSVGSLLSTTGLTKKTPAPKTNYSGTGNVPDVVDSVHMVHLSLSTGMDKSWPYGKSILDSVYKPYRQKELLEDAILIYRIQRAPERRIFYVDVGDLPPHKADVILEKVKTEIHQRRIPNLQGGSSALVDAAYNPLCLDLKTKIPLLDGRILTINELAEEYRKGKENWVYSCDPQTGKIVPGNITWAGTTKKNANVIKITLDNDKEIICTPDHKIPVLGKGFVQAKDIRTTDSLISWETKNYTITRGKKSNTYAQVFDHETNNWIFVHRMVAHFFKNINKHQEFTFLKENIDKDKNSIHHKDFNTYNNDPRNLQFMNHEDHKSFYTKFNKFSNENLSLSKSLIDTIKHKLENINKSFNSKSQGKFIYTRKMLEIIISTVKEHKSNRYRTAEILKYNTDLLLEIHKANHNINYDCFSVSELDNIIYHFGYKNWKEFFKNIHYYNHKIKKIEYLEESMDVGTITIDGQERWHNYHTFATESGIFVKNSILEDYFFAQTANGRGSKVETLPGGEGIANIDDLKYFNNKLVRGLGIPSAYLPTGPDDGGQIFSDGRVGTAFLQELRFSRYCERIQRILCPVFDFEFKLFVKSRGHLVESNLYEIEFNPPQNFQRNREMELDERVITMISQAMGIPGLSKRFVLERFGGFTPEEIQENTRKYIEENRSKLKNIESPMEDSDQLGLGSIGLKSEE